MKRAIPGLPAYLLYLCIALLPHARADYPIASHRYLADPAVLVHDGRVYFYCSNDDENVTDADYLMRSIVCVSSADLKNWTDHGVVFRVPENAAWASRSWAPAVNERDGTFFLYFANGASNIGVATSSSPIGPFNDPIGRPLVSSATPGASGPNMWLFDPFAFVDDDGQAYLYFGGNGEANTRVIKLNEDMVSVSGSATPIAPLVPGFFEASWMNKRNGVYYFSYSTNTANGLRIDYMTSDNPLNGFAYAGIVAGQPPSNNNNNHHGIFEFQGGWYHAYHNRIVAFEAGGPTAFKRNLALETLTFNPDNSIQQITYTRDGVTQVAALNPFERVEAETFNAQRGIETEPSIEGGMAVTSIANGDFLSLRGVNLASGIVALKARVAGAPGGSIQFRLDSVSGPLVATCAVPDTGALQAWTTVTTPIDRNSLQGVRDLFLVFSGGEGDNLLALDWWQFETDDPASPTTPAQPFNLTATLGPGQIKLAWAGDVGATGYRVKRSLNQGGAYAELVAETLGTAYTDTDLASGLAYYYTVAAFNDAGESPYSSEVGLAVTTTLSPVADAYVRAGASANSNFGADTTLAAKTDAGTPDFTRISLLRFDVAGLQDTASAILRLLPESGSAEIAITQLDYDLVANDNWSETAVTWNNQPPSSGSRIASLTGYAIGTPVQIDVTDALKAEAASDGLLSIQIESVISGPSKFVAFASREHPNASYRPLIIYQRPAPPPPANLAATVNVDEVTLSWDPSNGAAGYLVKRATATEGPYLFLAYGLQATHFTDPDAQPGTTYHYQVAATNSDNVSADSAHVTATPQARDFAWWIATKFPDETNPQIIGPNADPDQDSYTNLFEFFMGLDPATPNPPDLLSATIDETGNLVLTFPMATNLPGLTPSIIQSTDLKTWTNIGWPAQPTHPQDSPLQILIKTSLAPHNQLYQTLTLTLFP